MQRPAESSGERDQWRATGRRRRLVPFNECSSPLVMVCCLASGCRAGQLEPTPYRPSRVNLDSLQPIHKGGFSRAMAVFSAEGSPRGAT
jgi:hypothetical protein